MACTHTTNGFAPQPVGPSTTADLTKHVRFNLGMVLGVEDFTQEFTYLSGRDQWLARDLFGYGTALGLNLTLELREPKVPGGPLEPEVVVAPGVALSPRGRLVRVFPAQCARINDWLTAHQKELRDRAGPVASRTESLYVVLSYRECPTDPAPIPGEACRMEHEAVMPSRWTDDFQLTLTFTAPDQREEDALRQFVAWLRQVPVSDVTSPLSPPLSPPQDLLENFLAAIRAAAAGSATSPPSSPPGSSANFMAGSPPPSLRIPANRSCEFLRAAFRLWVTELRPRWRAPGLEPSADATTSQAASPDDGVLLAELRMPLVRDGGGVWRLADASGIRVVEERRPYLLHLRMLQEWLLCGPQECCGPASPPSGGFGPIPSDTVVAETTFGQAPAGGFSAAYSRADHTHGTPPDPIPPHQADANAHTLAGDATGPVGATTVARLRGVPVDAAAPTADQVLTFQTGQWRPANLPPAGVVPVPANTVTAAITFGQASSSGISAEYSRADHTHGTPPDPIPPHQADANAHTLAGDVTGPVGTTTVARLRGVLIDATAPTANQVLTFQTGQWRPAAPAAGPAPPAPGTTVVPEILFGQAAAVGTATAYSRADHTHGTPPDPIPAHQADANAHTLAGDVTGSVGTTTVARLRGVLIDATAPTVNQVLTFVAGQWRPAAPAVGPAPPAPGATVVSEILFGQAATAGAAAAYSRADHTHGTPPDPIPPHRTDANAHTLVGDVTGPVGTTTVAQLRGVPVNAAVPVENQVLTFRTGQWRPAGISGNFVGHLPVVGFYNIVAAGIIRAGGGVAMPPAYNNLAAHVIGAGRVGLLFDGYRIPDGSFQYIAKVLPRFQAQLRQLAVYFLDFHNLDGIILQVMNGGVPIEPGPLAEVILMVEISQYK